MDRNILSKSLGFTMVEILVVISIIGVLLAMGVVSYSTSQKKGRDARRKGDMIEIQKAMEQYYQYNSTSTYSYPAACVGSGSSLSITDTESYTIPTDPKNDAANGYVYTCSSTGTSDYCYCALLEAGSGGNFGATDCSTTGITYFCVKQLQ